MLFVMVVLQACSQKNNNIQKVQKNDTMITSILKSQLKDGLSSGDEFDPHNYNIDDLDATCSLIKKSLSNNGYQFPEKSLFIKRIKEIFHRIIDTTAQSDFIYVNLSNPCNRKPIFSRNKVTGNGVFISKNECFITELFAIPDLIDYKKNYPDLCPIEDEKIVRKNPDLGQPDLEMLHWKDVSDLFQQRQKNIDRIVYRNKYFFNNNASYLPWLWENDDAFLSCLVKKFGYTDDKKLLKLVFESTKPYVFDDNSSNPNDFGNLLWYKDCEDNVHVNQNVFAIIKEITTPESPEYLAHLSDYIIYLATVKEDILPFKQKAKLLAQLVSFGQNICLQPQYAETIATKGQPHINAKYKDLMVRQFVGIGDGDEKYMEEFKRNNYYNIPHLKEWWEVALKEVLSDPNNQ